MNYYKIVLIGSEKNNLIELFERVVLRKTSINAEIERLIV
jgi:hypothetical protein